MRDQGCEGEAMLTSIVGIFDQSCKAFSLVGMVSSAVRTLLAAIGLILR